MSVNKTVQRYPREIIQGAITKLEDGASLTAIAHELGVAKSTVSYWWSNAAKFMGKGYERDLNPKIAKIQNQIVEYGWKLYMKIIRKLNSTMDDASFRDLIYGASELQNRLIQLKPLQVTNSKISTTTEVEVSEERKVTVRNFLEKQKERTGQEKEEAKVDLAAGAPEPSPESKSDPLPNQGQEGKPNANEAI